MAGAVGILATRLGYANPDPFAIAMTAYKAGMHTASRTGRWYNDTARPLFQDLCDAVPTNKSIAEVTKPQQDEVAEALHNIKLTTSNRGLLVAALEAREPLYNAALRATSAVCEHTADKDDFAVIGSNVQMWHTAKASLQALDNSTQAVRNALTALVAIDGVYKQEIETLTAVARANVMLTATPPVWFQIVADGTRSTEAVALLNDIASRQTTLCLGKLRVAMTAAAAALQTPNIRQLEEARHALRASVSEAETLHATLAARASFLTDFDDEAWSTAAAKDRVFALTQAITSLPVDVAAALEMFLPADPPVAIADDSMAELSYARLREFAGALVGMNAEQLLSDTGTLSTACKRTTDWVDILCAYMQALLEILHTTTSISTGEWQGSYTIRLHTVHVCVGQHAKMLKLWRNRPQVGEVATVVEHLEQTLVATQEELIKCMLPIITKWHDSQYTIPEKSREDMDGVCAVMAPRLMLGMKGAEGRCYYIDATTNVLELWAAMYENQHDERHLALKEAHKQALGEVGSTTAMQVKLDTLKRRVDADESAAEYSSMISEAKTALLQACVVYQDTVRNVVLAHASDTDQGSELIEQYEEFVEARDNQIQLADIALAARAKATTDDLIARVDELSKEAPKDVQWYLKMLRLHATLAQIHDPATPNHTTACTAAINNNTPALADEMESIAELGRLTVDMTRDDKWDASVTIAMGKCRSSLQAVESIGSSWETEEEALSATKMGATTLHRVRANIVKFKEEHDRVCAIATALQRTYTHETLVSVVTQRCAAYTEQLTIVAGDVDAWARYASFVQGFQGQLKKLVASSRDTGTDTPQCAEAAALIQGTSSPHAVMCAMHAWYEAALATGDDSTLELYEAHQQSGKEIPPMPGGVDVVWFKESVERVDGHVRRFNALALDAHNEGVLRNDLAVMNEMGDKLMGSEDEYQAAVAFLVACDLRVRDAAKNTDRTLAAAVRKGLDNLRSKKEDLAELRAHYTSAAACVEYADVMSNEPTPDVDAAGRTVATLTEAMVKIARVMPHPGWCDTVRAPSAADALHFVKGGVMDTLRQVMTKCKSISNTLREAAPNISIEYTAYTTVKELLVSLLSECDSLNTASGTARAYIQHYPAHLLVRTTGVDATKLHTDLVAYAEDVGANMNEWMRRCDDVQITVTVVEGDLQRVARGVHLTDMQMREYRQRINTIYWEWRCIPHGERPRWASGIAQDISRVVGMYLKKEALASGANLPDLLVGMDSMLEGFLKRAAAVVADAPSLTARVADMLSAEVDLYCQAKQTEVCILMLQRDNFNKLNTQTEQARVKAAWGLVTTLDKLRTKMTTADALLGVAITRMRWCDEHPDEKEEAIRQLQQAQMEIDALPGPQPTQLLAAAEDVERYLCDLGGSKRAASALEGVLASLRSASSAFATAMDAIGTEYIAARQRLDAYNIAVVEANKRIRHAQSDITPSADSTNMVVAAAATERDAIIEQAVPLRERYHKCTIYYQRAESIANVCKAAHLAMDTNSTDVATVAAAISTLQAAVDNNPDADTLTWYQAAKSELASTSIRIQKYGTVRGGGAAEDCYALCSEVDTALQPNEKQTIGQLLLLAYKLHLTLQEGDATKRPDEALSKALLAVRSRALLVEDKLTTNAKVKNLKYDQKQVHPQLVYHGYNVVQLSKEFSGDASDIVTKWISEWKLFAMVYGKAMRLWRHMTSKMGADPTANAQFYKANTDILLEVGSTYIHYKSVEDIYKRARQMEGLHSGISRALATGNVVDAVELTKQVDAQLAACPALDETKVEWYTRAKAQIVEDKVTIATANENPNRVHRWALYLSTHAPSINPPSDIDELFLYMAEVELIQDEICRLGTDASAGDLQLFDAPVTQTLNAVCGMRVDRGDPTGYGEEAIVQFGMRVDTVQSCADSVALHASSYTALVIAFSDCLEPFVELAAYRELLAHGDAKSNQERVQAAWTTGLRTIMAARKIHDKYQQAHEWYVRAQAICTFVEHNIPYTDNDTLLESTSQVEQALEDGKGHEPLGVVWVKRAMKRLHNARVWLTPVSIGDEPQRLIACTTILGYSLGGVVIDAIPSTYASLKTIRGQVATCKGALRAGQLALDMVHDTPATKTIRAAYSSMAAKALPVVNAGTVLHTAVLAVLRSSRELDARRYAYAGLQAQLHTHTPLLAGCGDDQMADTRALLVQVDLERAKIQTSMAAAPTLVERATLEACINELVPQISRIVMRRRKKQGHSVDAESEAHKKVTKIMQASDNCVDVQAAMVNNYMDTLRGLTLDAEPSDPSPTDDIRVQLEAYDNLVECSARCQAAAHAAVECADEALDATADNTVAELTDHKTQLAAVATALNEVTDEQQQMAALCGAVSDVATSAVNAASDAVDTIQRSTAHIDELLGANPDTDEALQSVLTSRKGEYDKTVVALQTVLVSLVRMVDDCETAYNADTTEDDPRAIERDHYAVYRTAWELCAETREALDRHEDRRAAFLAAAAAYHKRVEGPDAHDALNNDIATDTRATCNYCEERAAELLAQLEVEVMTELEPENLRPLLTLPRNYDLVITAGTPRDPIVQETVYGWKQPTECAFRLLHVRDDRPLAECVYLTVSSVADGNLVTVREEGVPSADRKGPDAAVLMLVLMYTRPGAVANYRPAWPAAYHMACTAHHMLNVALADWLQPYVNAYHNPSTTLLALTNRLRATEPTIKVTYQLNDDDARQVRALAAYRTPPPALADRVTIRWVLRRKNIDPRAGDVELLRSVTTYERTTPKSSILKRALSIRGYANTYEPYESFPYVQDLLEWTNIMGAGISMKDTQLGSPYGSDPASAAKIAAYWRESVALFEEESDTIPIGKNKAFYLPPTAATNDVVDTSFNWFGLGKRRKAVAVTHEQPMVRSMIPTSVDTGVGDLDDALERFVAAYATLSAWWVGKKPTPAAIAKWPTPKVTSEYYGIIDNDEETISRAYIRRLAYYMANDTAPENLAAIRETDKSMAMENYPLLETESLKAYRRAKALCTIAYFARPVKDRKKPRPLTNGVPTTAQQYKRIRGLFQLDENVVMAVDRNPYTRPTSTRTRPRATAAPTIVTRSRAPTTRATKERVPRPASARSSPPPPTSESEEEGTAPSRTTDARRIKPEPPYPPLTRTRRPPATGEDVSREWPKAATAVRGIKPEPPYPPPRPKAAPLTHTPPTPTTTAGGGRKAATAFQPAPPVERAQTPPPRSETEEEEEEVAAIGDPPASLSTVVGLAREDRAQVLRVFEDAHPTLTKWWADGEIDGKVHNRYKRNADTGSVPVYWMRELDLEHDARSWMLDNTVDMRSRYINHLIYFVSVGHDVAALNTVRKNPSRVFAWMKEDPPRISAKEMTSAREFAKMAVVVYYHSYAHDEGPYLTPHTSPEQYAQCRERFRLEPAVRMADDTEHAVAPRMETPVPAATPAECISLAYTHFRKEAGDLAEWWLTNHNANSVPTHFHQWTRNSEYRFMLNTKQGNIEEQYLQYLACVLTDATTSTDALHAMRKHPNKHTKWQAVKPTAVAPARMKRLQQLARCVGAVVYDLIPEDNRPRYRTPASEADVNMCREELGLAPI